MEISENELAGFPAIQFGYETAIKGSAKGSPVIVISI